MNKNKRIKDEEKLQQWEPKKWIDDKCTTIEENKMREGMTMKIDRENKWGVFENEYGKLWHKSELHFISVEILIE